MKPKVLILEDSQKSAALLQSQFRGEPIGIMIVETAAEAREIFERVEFDVIALDGIAPSEAGRNASLVGPVLARWFRENGYMDPIIAISDNLEARQLTKQEAERQVKHRAYACEKLKLIDLIRELLGIYSTPSK